MERVLTILRPTAQLLREMAQDDGLPPSVLLERLVVAEALRRALPIDPDAVRCILPPSGEEGGEGQNDRAA